MNNFDFNLFQAQNLPSENNSPIAAEQKVRTVLKSPPLNSVFEVSTFKLCPTFSGGKQFRPKNRPAPGPAHPPLYGLVPGEIAGICIVFCLLFV